MPRGLQQTTERNREKRTDGVKKKKEKKKKKKGSRVQHKPSATFQLQPLPFFSLSTSSSGGSYFFSWRDGFIRKDTAVAPVVKYRTISFFSLEGGGGVRPLFSNQERGRHKIFLIFVPLRRPGVYWNWLVGLVPSLIFFFILDIFFRTEGNRRPSFWNRIVWFDYKRFSTRLGRP